MEVMREIYQTLKALGIEWKEKIDLDGLGVRAFLKDNRGSDRARIERARELDGYVDLRGMSAIYSSRREPGYRALWCVVPLDHWTKHVGDTDMVACPV